jgi:predicted MFS family arabinose efflux permease
MPVIIHRERANTGVSERKLPVTPFYLQPVARSRQALLGSALLVSLGAAVGQGFARFGYALLLPPMQQSLGWTYAQAGVVNSANALGYLGGALAVGPFVARWGAPRVVRLSLLAVSLSLIASGLFSAFWVLLVARVVAGAGAGLMFIGGVAVVLALDASHRSDLPVGVYYAGPGIGIAVSGVVVPWLLGALGWEWHAVWVALGALGILVQGLIEPPLRQAAQARRLEASASAPAARLVLGDYVRLWPGMLAYTLFGLGYIGYMTFVIAFLRATQVPPLVIQGFWVLLGVCAALCGFTWRPVLHRLAPHHALSCILVALCVGAALPVVVNALWSFALSAVLFGSSFLAVVTAITAQVRRTLPAERWTTIMGNATALFALGQLLGPTLTGLIADTSGGLVLGLRGSAALLGVAAAIALIKPKNVARG